MSDPVANVEIEDVLTSIRRLVSEGGRPAGAARTQRPNLPDMAVPVPVVESVSEAESLDRLVLTPAQRIPERDASVVSAEAEDLSDFEVDEGDFAEASELDGPELLLHPILDDGEEELHQDAFEGDFEDDVEDVDALSEEEEHLSADFDPDEGIALSEAQAMESRIVRWENLNPDSESDVVEPDSPGDNDYAGTDVRGLSWIEPASDALYEAADEAAEVDEVDSAEEITFDDEQQAAGEVELPTFLHAAASEAVEVHAYPEADIPDANLVRSETDPEIAREASETFEAISGRVEAEATAYVEETVEDAVAPEFEDFDVDDSVMLDEAMLRELVSDIVRQELQGALGERITRNVRKLVRREIHRALAAHDLE